MIRGLIQHSLTALLWAVGVISVGGAGGVVLVALVFGLPLLFAGALLSILLSYLST